MQERHQNKDRYFQEQAITTKKYVIPYIEKILPVTQNTKVLEIGCAEGGNLLPFLDIGCMVTGIDISASRIQLAEKFFMDHPARKNLQLITDDIYKAHYLNESFDLVILRDVIEHIPNQEFFMEYVKKFLRPGGKVFFGFPPWQNPFGGHQQIVHHRILSKLPYYHLLPRLVYRYILKLAGASAETIKALMEIRDTGISIDRFEKILKKTGYKIDRKTFYFINPNYETKFKIKPREQLKPVSALPFLRNFFVTAAYYVVSSTKN